MSVRGNTSLGEGIRLEQPEMLQGFVSYVFDPKTETTFFQQLKGGDFNIDERVGIFFSNRLMTLCKIAYLRIRILSICSFTIISSKERLIWIAFF